MAKPRSTGHARKRKGKGDTLQEAPVADQEREAKQRELEAKADEILRGGKSAESIDAATGEVHLVPGEKVGSRRAKGTKLKKGDKVPTVATHTKRRFERMLPVKLTPVELREKSRALANSVDEIAGVEARKKAANDGFKSDLEQWKGVQSALSRQVDSGEESRPVKCREVHDYLHKQVLEYRDDTNDLIGKREMSESEMQLGFELDEAV